MIAARQIQAHYDRCSWLYAKLWGPHLHHGFWTDGETVEEAQVKLVEVMASAAGIAGGETVLDAGSGLGGSSLWLAANKDCRVTGVTLSPVQARMAASRARRQGLADRARFVRGDLETIDLPDAGFDRVWSIECTEHLMDKARFIARAAGWLKPGGRLAVCAWTAADDSRQTKVWIEKVCAGFLCPSLATAGDYGRWAAQASLSVEAPQDLTPHVMKTWEICIQRTQKAWVSAAALLLGRDTRLFLKSFPVILGAYKSGALRYSLITAKK